MSRRRPDHAFAAVEDWVRHRLAANPRREVQSVRAEDAQHLLAGAVLKDPRSPASLLAPAIAVASVHDLSDLLTAPRSAEPNWPAVLDAIADRVTKVTERHPMVSQVRVWLLDEPRLSPDRRDDVYVAELWFRAANEETATAWIRAGRAPGRSSPTSAFVRPVVRHGGDAVIANAMAWAEDDDQEQIAVGCALAAAAHHGWRPRARDLARALTEVRDPRLRLLIQQVLVPAARPEDSPVTGPARAPKSRAPGGRHRPQR